MIILVIIAALLFDFANGWNDSANAIATVVSTRVLSPFKAVLLAAALNFAGAYLSTKVAKAIGGSIVDPMAITMT
ncbi:MAG TPA: anion permease, partial [Deltaproteobacteria bacterium]|nr:anion permease [Deltaproteobacteria bacterium]